MRSRRLVSVLICATWFAPWLLNPPPARSDDLAPELVDALKFLVVPHTDAFLRHHGELVEHNTELCAALFRVPPE